MDYRVFPPDEILQCSINLPASKSYEARRMVIDTLAGMPVESSDTCHDIEVLCDALPVDTGTIDLGGSGTALRLLTAVKAASDGADVTLDGNESLRRRPIGILVEALRSLGADISWLGQEGFAPVHITGRKLAGGSVTVDVSRSSQFVSALMLIAPLLDGGLTINFDGEPVSLPYIKMTVAMMRRRGIAVELERDRVVVSRGQYNAPDDREPESDWTAASYWYEIAAITAGWVSLPGLHADDLQGDRWLADIFPRMGVLTDFEAEDEDGAPLDGAELSATPDLYGRIELDLSDHPDLAPTIAVTSAALSLPFKLTGLANLRDKECDRLSVIVAELYKIGVVAEIDGAGTLLWEGRRRPVTQMPVIDPHGDHRIAMAFAPLAVFIPGIIIADSEVVDKSYPDYWDHLRQAGFVLTDASEPLPES